jgi:ATP/maltotriose-dependent transcriptional regulator MalT
MNLPIQDNLINALQRQIPQILMCEWQARWYLICSHQFSSTFGLPSQIICGKVHYSVSAESKMIQLETLPLMLQKILQTSHKELAANLDPRELRALAQHYCIAGRMSRNKSDISRRKLKQSLSVREIEVLKLIAQGLSMKAIAGRLEISHHTVNTYHKTIYRKLSANSKIEAIMRAQAIGVL